MIVITRTDHHLVYEENGIVYEQRTGEAGRTYASLQEYYTMTSGPIARWQAHCQANILTPGGQIIDGLLTAGRLAVLTQAGIDATEPGNIVPNTTWTKEQAQELMLLATHVLTFVQTPIYENGPTPQDIISKYA